jgi:hypothetical protein
MGASSRVREQEGGEREIQKWNKYTDISNSPPVPHFMKIRSAVMEFHAD